MAFLLLGWYSPLISYSVAQDSYGVATTPGAQDQAIAPSLYDTNRFNQSTPTTYAPWQQDGYFALFGSPNLSEFLPSLAAAVSVAGQDVLFKASIDERRTLRLEGTDAAETIIAEVAGDPASIAIEYRGTGEKAAPQEASFPLNAFDRLVVNARGGDDFVNIIDPAELLDAQKKILSLDGGDGNNVVVLSHEPFKPETARRMMSLLDLSRQLEDLARRASEATSAALTNDALKFIDNMRVNVADVAKSIQADAKTQVLDPAQALVDRSQKQVHDLSESFTARLNDLARQHGDLVADLTKKYDPTNGVFPPDDDREQPAAPGVKPGAERLRPNMEELEGARLRVEKQTQSGLKLGTETQAQAERLGMQIQREAQELENRATEFERRAEQLSTTAEGLAAQGEKDLTAASDRVLAIVAELKAMAGSFEQVGMAVRDEIMRAISMTSPATQPSKAAKAAGGGCSTPIVTTHSYTGGPQNDFFFPFSAPNASWSINGGGGNDVLGGGLADDDIHGGPGNDIVFGLKGDDQIHGDADGDLLFGEWIWDIPSMTGNDCIWGDGGLDVMGGDNISDAPGGTPGGDDYLWGGDDTDLIFGDDIFFDILSQTHLGGKDTIEGNDGSDVLFGCGGDDIIHGNDGIDFAEGNGGDDHIYGDDGRDFQFCNTTVHLGNLLLGGNDNDEVYGGKGIDFISGNKGDDKLTGADQTDLIFGGGGGDNMYGDAGGTICIINGIPINLGNFIYGDTGDDNMWAGGEPDAMIGGDGDDHIYGYDGSGQMPGSIDLDVLVGGLGNDFLEGDNEPLLLFFSLDIEDGGPGDDVLYGGKDPDILVGGTGADTIYGDSNSILPWMVASMDLIVGGPDDDWADGGNGFDVILGRDGDDNLKGDDETFGLISPDFISGGNGIDTINGGVFPDLILGRDGTDVLSGDSNYLWEVTSIDIIFGGLKADNIDGGNGDDLLMGEDGDDTIQGDNSTWGEISVDFILGGKGKDEEDGGASPDLICGNDGDDTMWGDTFSWMWLSLDVMLGNDGCDTMYGGRALDIMSGGRGADQMHGEEGPDIISGDDDGDIINGGSWPDLIDGAAGNDLIHGDAGLDWIAGSSGNDFLYGDIGADLMFGGDGNDCMHGGSGWDVMLGRDGNDLMFGDSGWDYLGGENDDDTLDGGTGWDLLIGGPGNDTAWGGPGPDLLSAETTDQDGSSGLDCTYILDPGTLCVHKFNDLNGDGDQDAGELGLPNFVFQVNGAGGAQTLTTNANGLACASVPGGTYTVVETPQPGWIASTPTTLTIWVPPCQTADVYFGNRATGTLCIHKFNDLNGNGVNNGEPGLPNWTFQASGASSATFISGANGLACSVVPVGTYTVVEQGQIGWASTTPMSQTVTVTANQTTHAHFGNKKVPIGKLCVHKFNDLNGNGVQDVGELDLPNWIFQVSGNTSATLTTGANGSACTGLSAGAYTVIETPKVGWAATTPTTQIVTVIGGQTTNVNFGNTQSRGELCIQKFNDLNGNGVRELGEPGLANWSFTVTGSSGTSTTLVTLGGGSICTGLPVGTYTVVEILKSGWTATTPTTQTVTVTAGQAANVLFGNR